MAEEPEFWMVVCSELHRCVGPFPSPVEAMTVAENLTAQGGCVYVPVEMEFVGEVAMFETREEMEETFGRQGHKEKVEEVYHRGQYL